jgi:hypothetical protein
MVVAPGEALASAATGRDPLDFKRYRSRIRMTINRITTIVPSPMYTGQPPLVV